MGQAKRRQAEIEKLKAQGPKHKAHNIKGYRPDAGLNSEEGTNYYWFQVAEMIQSTAGIGARSYFYKGKNWLELNTPVDIMDKDGKKQIASHQQDGYFATFRLSPKMLEQLSEQIAKGAMSVRMTGCPNETATSPTGEKFRIIEVTDVWSAGNNAGFMTYMVQTKTGMIHTNSKLIANGYYQAAKQLEPAQ